jgi:mono/diheme cytochrome c family protein
MRTLGVVAVAFVLAGPALATTGSPLAGKAVFKAKCGSCHTLKAAGTVGKGDNHGPTLTNKRETVAKIMKEMSGGNTGLMPTFVGMLSTKQVNDVVAFVVAASKYGVTTIK